MKKNRYIIYAVFVIFVIVSIIGLALINTNENAIVETMTEEKKVDRIDYIHNIKYGDNFEKVTEDIGFPDRFEGDNVKYPVYDLSNTEKAIVLTFDGKVIFLSVVEDEQTKYLMDVPKYDESNATDKLEDYNMFYNKSDCILELSDFDKIESGYTYFDVLMTVGRPIGNCGSGRIIDVYVLRDGTVVRAAYNSKGSIGKIEYMENGEWVIRKY